MLTKMRTDYEYEKAVELLMESKTQGRKSEDAPVPSFWYGIGCRCISMILLLAVCVFFGWLRFFYVDSVNKPIVDVTFFVFMLAYVLVGWGIRDRYIKELVRKTSRSYKELLRLNGTVKKPVGSYYTPRGYSVNVHDGVVRISACYVCDSKREFDRFNGSRVVSECVKDTKGFFSTWVRSVNETDIISRRYKESVTAIQAQDDLGWDFLSKRDKRKISRRRYDRLVSRLIRDNVLDFASDLEFTLFYSYTSPKGRNHYSDIYTAHMRDIFRLCGEAVTPAVRDTPSGNSVMQRHLEYLDKSCRDIVDKSSGKRADKSRKVSSKSANNPGRKSSNKPSSEPVNNVVMHTSVEYVNGSFRSVPNTVWGIDKVNTTCEGFKFAGKRSRAGKVLNAVADKLPESGTNTVQAHSDKQDNDIVHKSSEEFRKKQRSLMTPKFRYKILERDNFRCVLCGCTAEESIAMYGHGLEVDHIIPVSRGGRTVESNLRTLCFGCNRGKGADIEKKVV